MNGNSNNILDSRALPIEYYEGVADGARYALNALNEAYLGVSHMDTPTEVNEVTDLLEELLDKIRFRREDWFVHHNDLRKMDLSKLKRDERV
jgi:hypothetical protein